MSDSRSDSPTNQSSQPPAKTGDRARTERQRRSSGVAWFLAGLMLALVLAFEIPNEIVAWRFAAALEAREAGDKERAHQLLREVLERQPDENRYQAQLYEWYLEDGKYEEALAFLQERFAAKPTQSNVINNLRLLRSQVYLHLRRYPEAIADCRELKRSSEATGQPTRVEALNGLAYARALGDLELDEALVDIDAAIVESRAELLELEQKVLDLKRNRGDTLEAGKDAAIKRRELAGCLDTRGLVRMKLGQVVRAKADFDEAIQGSQQCDEYFRHHRNSLNINFKEYEKASQRNQAVIFYHRGLNFELLGMTEEAKRDFAKAKEFLGKEPDDTLF